MILSENVKLLEFFDSHLRRVSISEYLGDDFSFKINKEQCYEVFADRDTEF